MDGWMDGLINLIYFPGRILVQTPDLDSRLWSSDQSGHCTGIGAEEENYK